MPKKGAIHSVLTRKVSRSQVHKALNLFFYSPLWKNKWFVRLFCSLCVFIFIVSQIPLALTTDVDSPSYYTAAVGIKRGVNIYEEESFQHQADLIYGKAFTILPFIYAPLIAQLFIPISLLNPSDYSLVLLISNILVTLFCIYLLADLLKLFIHPSGLPFLFLCSLLIYNFPLFRTLKFGQLNMWIMACILISLRLDKKDKPFFSSLFLMLAVFSKIFPAIFLVFYLLQKRFRYILFAFVNGIVLVLISVLISGISYWINYIQILFKSFVLGEKPLYFFDFAASLNNNSLKAFFTQLLQHFNISRSHASLMVVLFLAGCIFLVRKKIKPFILIKDQNFYLSVLITLPLFLSSMCWQHHFVSLVIPFVYLFALIIEKRNYSILIPFFIIYTTFAYFPPYGGFPFNHMRLFAAIFSLPLLYRVYFSDTKKKEKKKELSHAA